MRSNSAPQWYIGALMVALCATTLAQPPGWDELVRKAKDAIAKGEYTTANNYLSAALAELQGAPESDPRWGVALNILGIVKHHVGDFESATALFEKALRIFEDTAGSPDLATVLYNLGQTQRERGKYTDAERSLQRSLTINRSLYPAGSLDVAQTLTELGIV